MIRKGFLFTVSQKKKFKVVLVAGEPSGDFLGAQLMKALKKKTDFIEFFGIGGYLMEKEGIRSFFPLSDLSIMGIFENWRQTLKAWKRLKETKNLIVGINPDLVVTMDFPGFNFRLGKGLRKRLKETPLIHYVAPTVWAWRPGRAKKVSKFLTHLLTLFPFEPPYFKKYKLPTTFVGHPVVELGFDEGSKQRFMKRYEISKEETLLTILPGSRIVELKHHLDIFQKTVDMISTRIPRLKVVIPTLPDLEGYLKSHWSSSVPMILVTEIQEKKDAYAASSMAIAASGTIALELAQANLPMIIAYKVSPVSAWIIRASVQVKYCCMVNILLRKYIVPEFLQKDCTPTKLCLEALKILKNPQKRQQQLEAFARVNELLRPATMTPSEKAASVVLRYLQPTEGG
ncbi:MAG TPA: lipid-A-disaccharide synthase [Holosporales bacterium]|nr:lipid-A-disaccharide synthase [Holosporales bacterium]